MKLILFSFLIILIPFFTFAKTPLSFMTWNVHNAFDTSDDPNHPGDAEYLPADHPQADAEKNKNWTEEKYEIKVGQITKVITMMINELNDGDPLDFFVLTEVENEKVLEDIATPLGYSQFYVTNSTKDYRGIDIGFVYKESDYFKIISIQEHEVRSTKYIKGTRNILEIHAKVHGEDLLIIGAHWPSQYAPAEARKQVAIQVNKLIQKRSRRNPGLKAMVLGDFNTITQDRPDPFYEVLESQDYPPVLFDTDSNYRDWDSGVDWKKKKGLSLGTYLFDSQWNILDRVFVTPNLITPDGLALDLHSYTIFANDEMTRTLYFDERYPWGRNGVHPKDRRYGIVMPGAPKYPKTDQEALDPKTAGYSDHFPVFARIGHDLGQTAYPWGTVQKAVEEQGIQATDDLLSHLCSAPKPRRWGK